MIEIKKSHINTDYFDKSDIEQAADMFNGIMYELIYEGKYRRGARNNYAVDLGIVCYILSINHAELIAQLYARDVFPHASENKYEIIDRLDVVWRYCDKQWQEYAMDFALDAYTHTSNAGKLGDDSDFRVVVVDNQD